MATPPLSRFAEPLPWDVRVLGELRPDGAVSWEAGVLPALGPCVLVLWRPDARPQFALARGRLLRAGRGWRFQGVAAAPAWIVLASAEPF